MIHVTNSILDGLAGPAGPQGVPGPQGPVGAGFGISYLGNYIPTNGYLPNVAVVRGSDGQLYLAKASGQLGDPINYATNNQWEVWIPKGADGANGSNGTDGLDGADGTDALWNFTGEWVNGIDYAAGSVVEFQGSCYYHPNGQFSSYSPPTNGWLLVASKGEQGIQGEPGPIGETGPTGAPGVTNVHNAVNAATTQALSVSWVYTAGTTGADGGTGIGATLTLSNTGNINIDGPTVLQGQRILIKDQTDQKQNGIYYVTQTGGSNSQILTRATDYNNNTLGQVAQGDEVLVLAGTLNGNKVFYQGLTGTATGNTIKIGTDNIAWTQTANLLNVSTNIIPAVDNTYDLGSTSYRWKSVNIGPGTLTITDQSTGLPADLTVNAGVLKIDGANQLQVGQLKFIDNTIESTTGSTDIQIGLLASTADIVLNRDVLLGTGKTLTFSDATVQTTAYISPGLTSYASTWAGTGLVFSGTPTTAIYARAGKIIQFQIAVACTNVSNFGTGGYSLTLPVAADGPASISGILTIGATIYPIVGTTTYGSTIVTLYGQTAGGGGSKLVLDPLTKNSLGTFTTSTTFNLAGSYLAQ
jgi:hypothetical protein